MRTAIRGILFIAFELVLFMTVPDAFYNMFLANSNIDIATADILIKVWILVIPCLLYMYIFRNDININECIKFNRLSLKQVSLLVFIGVLIQPFAMLISSMTTVFFNNEVAEYLEMFSKVPFFMMLLSMAVMPALMEELMMRGIVFYESKELKLTVAAILNGALFGLLHRNFSQFFYAMALGILFVYIVNITNSLFSTMIIHFMINGTQVVLAKAFYSNANVESISSIEISLLSKIWAVGFFVTICIIFLPMLVWSIKKLIKVSKKDEMLSN